MTKSEAIQQVKAAGYTVQVAVSESGDHGYGSRVYYAKTGTDPQNFDWAKTKTASISKVGRIWLTSYPS